MDNKKFPVLHTKFGKAGYYNGYYMITSTKEGNANKKLHRLVYEDYHKCTLLPNIDIHHIDGNSTNNCVLNLEAVNHNEHISRHHKGLPMPDNVKEALRKANIGKPPSAKNLEALRKANLGNKYNYKYV